MKKETFICNKCERVITKDVNENYPYGQGWVYIYLFEYKVDSNIKSVKDKHFCSKSCLSEYIDNLIKSE